MQMKLKTGLVKWLCAGILLGAGNGMANAEENAAAQSSATQPPVAQAAAGAEQSASSAANGKGTASGAGAAVSRPPAPRYPAPRQAYRGYRAPSGYGAPRYRTPYQGRYRAPVRTRRAPYPGYRTPPSGYRAGTRNYRRPPQAYRSPRPGYRNPAPRHARKGNVNGPRRNGYRPKDKGNVNFGSRPSRPRYRSRPRYNDDDDGGLSFNIVDLIPWDDDTRMPWENKHWKGFLPEKLTDKFGEKWDDMVNEPSKHKLPGGWYPPSIDAPNPAEVANEFDNAARDFKKNNQ